MGGKPPRQRRDRASELPGRRTGGHGELVGLVMTRHVIAIEPVATMPAEAVAAAVAPTIQRYLLGPLTPRDR
jgi:hypothetical protein